MQYILYIGLILIVIVIPIEGTYVSGQRLRDQMYEGSMKRPHVYT